MQLLEILLHLHCVQHMVFSILFQLKVNHTAGKVNLRTLVFKNLFISIWTRHARFPVQLTSSLREVLPPADKNGKINPFPTPTQITIIVTDKIPQSSNFPCCRLQSVLFLLIYYIPISFSVEFFLWEVGFCFDLVIGVKLSQKESLSRLFALPVIAEERVNRGKNREV